MRQNGASYYLRESKLVAFIKRFKASTACLLGLCLMLLGGPARAQVPPAFFDSMAACTATSTPLAGTYDTAIASATPIRGILYPLAGVSCPGWTLAGIGYLVVQASPSPGLMPAPATQAIWLNENGGTMTRTVSGLTIGQSYTVSVQTWTDDIDGPTALRLEFGPETRILNLAANQGPQPLSATVCARSTSLPLLMRQQGTTNASPIVTNVRLVDDGTTCLFTVSYDSQGGSAVAPQTNVEYDARANQPTPPARAGYTFGGWYTEPALTNPYDFSTPVTNNITLYARWVAGPGFTVGGQVNGLGAGAPAVVLANSNGDTVSSTGGAFTFPSAVPNAASYAVTVATQPAGYVCSVTANGTGTVPGANVTNVIVTCVATVAPAVPTLGTWGLLLMVALMGLAAVAARRRLR